MERLYLKAAFCLSFIFQSFLFLQAKPENYDLFASDEVLKVHLDFDIKQLLKGKYKESYP